MNETDQEDQDVAAVTYDGAEAPEVGAGEGGNEHKIQPNNDIVSDSKRLFS